MDSCRSKGGGYSEVALNFTGTMEVGAELGQAVQMVAASNAMNLAS